MTLIIFMLSAVITALIGQQVTRLITQLLQ